MNWIKANAQLITLGCVVIVVLYVVKQSGGIKGLLSTKVATAAQPTTAATV